MQFRTVVYVLFAIFGYATMATAGDNWPEFRGPSMQGVSDSTGLPIKWSETENIAWKTKIEGRGWSTPVIWGKQVWMTTATEDGKQMFAVCVDADNGKMLRYQKVFDVADPQPIIALNSYASPSPVIEEGRVYVHFGTYGTACLDTDSGKMLWQRRDINCDHYRGPGSSPIAFRDLLIFHMDGIDVQYVIALDRATGETVWKTSRSIDYSPHDPDLRKAYSTPLVVNVDGSDMLVTTAAKAAFGYDPATGKELWFVRYNGYSNTSRPACDDTHMYLNSGFGKADLLAIPLTARGEIGAEQIRWQFGKGVSTKPSKIVANGRIYFVADKGGVLTCLDAKSGESLWMARLGGNFSASPLLAEGRIYFSSHEGVTTVIEEGPKFKRLAENTLDDGFMSSPAVSGRALFLRTRSHLYRIEE